MERRSQDMVWGKATGKPDLRKKNGQPGDRVGVGWGVGGWSHGKAGAGAPARERRSSSRVGPVWGRERRPEGLWNQSGKTQAVSGLEPDRADFSPRHSEALGPARNPGPHTQRKLPGMFSQRPGVQGWGTRRHSSTSGGHGGDWSQND
jgi:hypothetical protein